MSMRWIIAAASSAILLIGNGAAYAQAAPSQTSEAGSTAQEKKPDSKPAKTDQDAASALNDFKSSFNKCDGVASDKKNECRLALINIQDSSLDTQKASQTFHLFSANSYDPSKFHQRIVFQRYTNIKFDDLTFRIGVGFFVSINDDSSKAGAKGVSGGTNAQASDEGRRVDITINSLGIVHKRVQQLMPVAPELTESFLNRIGKSFVDGFNADSKANLPGILADSTDELKVCPQILGHDDPAFLGKSADEIAKLRTPGYEQRVRRDIGLLTKITNNLAACEKVVPNTSMHFFSLSKSAESKFQFPLLVSASDSANSGAIVQEYRRYRFVDGYGIKGAAALYIISGSEQAGGANLASSIGAAIINFSSNSAKIRSRFLVYGNRVVSPIPAAPSEPSYGYVFTVYKSFEDIKDELKDVSVQDLVTIEDENGNYVVPTSSTTQVSKEEGQDK